MSSYKISKQKITAGNIVRFRYNDRRRYVLVMECPNDPGRRGKFITKEGKLKRFLHGIELPIPDKKVKVELIIKKMGGTRVLFESNKGIRFYTVNFGDELEDIMNARTAYEKVKSDVENMNTYRTYEWDKISNNISFDSHILDFEKLVHPKYREKEI